MTPDQRLCLSAHVESIRAEELLVDRGGDLSPDGLRSLVLIATGDQDMADKAAARRVHELDRAQMAAQYGE